MKRMTIDIELADGRKFTVQTVTKDYVAYDQTAKRQKPPWGPMSDNVALWEAFCGWAAAKRSGEYAGGWDAFLDDCVSVETRAAGEDVDPTLQGAGDGLSPS
jgi:hypothetical protein